MKQSFYGGVHPNDRKEATRHKAVTPLGAAPQQVVIAMSMHIGAPCKSVVAKGDHVTVGQKIGEIAGLGAPIHASVSGTVTAVEPRPYPGGNKVMSVVIENDFQDTFGSDLTPHPDYSKLTADEIVEIIKEAGVTGMGGAGFPTHVKISSGIGKVDTLILNGAECEPYITADHRLMLEQGERVIGGARILMQAFGLQSATIGVEANKPDAIEHLQALVGARADVHVESLRTRYPQGAEKQLIQRLTGREVPPGGLPAHVGCAVFNVGTAAAVYDAVVEGKPVTHRIVTVTGDAVKEPCNLLVPLGTSFQHLIDEAKGFAEEPDRVLTGGPMMGIAQHTLEVGIIKGTNAVLCLTRKEAAPIETEEVCLRCARCVNVCPMHLTPVYMHLYAGKGMWKEAEALNVMDCIECGSCNYICPGRLHLVQSFRMTKMELRQLAAKEKAAKEAAKA
ncbi:electron transport complex subunit RsxC [Flavonifractor sp. DFI.6.63]|uniref:Ion-translocating oxidoreductase complex subunit C n=1 Tax=Lawsonibacter hominis TaxID=2763053 RepID=A0A8J6JDF8_9FIRM|nr:MULTISPECIES: electron transport complex subunit RsxC [Oscillospiraceae]MBS1385144.1 electron transport complex subunit RsxC [Flavonifractor sp.]MDU2196550.1 electron transport complex subunit RsxC [Clostridiales bacterium]MDY2976204.1 electron transport complex subunit RsxC [Oscillospiraceae bacterium]MBC5733868.1 electron transport complex subunit RsxC [Lawsonibacter hominis]MCQ5030345.1 electron transport complex subunit RsxC [Flavonifractor sp. DFI.6.63]